jgi:hypothetical protein
VSSFQAFPKIFHIGERYIDRLFDNEVEITEKIDGSQFSFGIDSDGLLMMRSKGNVINEGGTPKMFVEAVEQAKRIYEIIKNYANAGNWTDIQFYCEYLQKPHHNCLNYERVPKNYLYLFGFRDKNNFLDTDSLIGYAALFNIEPPNILYKGRSNPEEIKQFLERDSILGKEKVEGIVVKNYVQPAMVGGIVIPLSMGKYVREEFKERNAHDWKEDSGKSKLDVFIQSFKNEARWHKAYQYLKEADELTYSPKDIGMLIPVVLDDIVAEEEGNIKDFLYKLYLDDIKRVSISGLPEWWKEGLAMGKFKEEMGLNK